MVAKSRLELLGKRLERDPQLFNKYKLGIQELLEKGYAEKLSDEGLKGHEGKT